MSEWLRLPSGVEVSLAPPVLIHPRVRLAALLRERGLTVVEAARRLRVSRPGLNNVLHGHVGIGPKMAVRVASVFGGSAEQWYVDGQRVAFLKHVNASSLVGKEK